MGKAKKQALRFAPMEWPVRTGHAESVRVQEIQDKSETMPKVELLQENYGGNQQRR